MRGHEPLIAMRLRGRVPRSCCLSIFPVKAWVVQWHQHPATEGDATVEVTEQEARSASRLDLRFLVGLKVVIVNGPDSALTTALAEAALAAGALRVIAVYFDLSLPAFDQLVRIQEFQQTEVDEHGERHHA